jgi:hypothetical protein
VKHRLRAVCDGGTAANEGNPSKGMNRVTGNALVSPVDLRVGRKLATGNVTDLKAGSGVQ